MERANRKVVIFVIINKRLRKNYKQALKLKNANECNQFMASLDEKSRHELLTYVDGYVIKSYLRKGIQSNRGYFLDHYGDYISNGTKEVYKCADKTLNLIYAIAIIIAFIFIKELVLK